MEIIINESEVVSAANTAKELAIGEIRDIRSCWGTDNADDHDRMLCNLSKAMDTLKDSIIVKATMLAAIAGGATAATAVLREVRPLATPSTVVERATATIS